MDDYFIKNCYQKQNNGHHIENMHNPQIEARGSVRVFFPEEIHQVNVR